ncbi:MAG TPA: histidinol-phosphatase [Chitinispirillaceae bacterium]|nr:histidinol-phosphatase [Chitinispirillaceae bacterium]
MLADYHVHTPYCGHAHGKIIQYVESAIQSGLHEICFADHLGRYYLSKSQKHRYWDWGMNERNIGRYFSELSDLQEIYQKEISIKIGLEVDYIEGAEELLRPYLDNFKFDFILCSIHCMPRFSWQHLSLYSKDTDTLPFYKEYFRLARQALQSPFCDSLAHLDFIWRHIALPANSHDLILQEVADIVYTAARLNRCIEINANGYIWSRTNYFANDFDPFIFLVDQLQLYNAPVTIGSDAHDPMMVGKAFEDLISLLNTRNIKTIHTFSNRVQHAASLG